MRAAETLSPQGSDEQKIGDFWVAAMDVERARRHGIRPLQDQLAQIRGIESLEQAIDIAFALRPLQVDLFFHLDVDQDLKDSNTASVYLEQGGLGLPDRSYYVRGETRIHDKREKYVAHIGRMLTLLGRSYSAATRDAAKVMAFETSLAKVSRDLEEKRDPDKNYNRVALRDLSEQYTPLINWNSYLASWNLNPEFIELGQPEYFKALDKILTATPVQILKDYMQFRLVSEYANYLSPEFDDEHFNFYGKVLREQKEQRRRWVRVLGTENLTTAQNGTRFSVPSPIGMLVGRRFVKGKLPRCGQEAVHRTPRSHRDGIP
jgi:putative endopeptidase